MALFTVKLSDEHRVALEAHRVRLGAKSEAEALRQLIIPRGPEPGRYFRDADEAIAMLEAEARPGRAILINSRPKGDPTPISPKAYADIQIGPIKREAGSLFKKPKGISQ